MPSVIFKIAAAKTTDKGRFYTVMDLGAKRSTTPEGFLVCHDVPIARTGTQLYLDTEIPLEGVNGEIRIERSPDEVFRADTVSSFEGKAVTVEHPNDFVTPENWQQLAIGITQNVRRGTGIQDDLLIADLVITERSAIEYVNSQLPEVSAGYEAGYEQTAPGYGRQINIVGNHVALVDRGRAGPRCSIQDGAPKMPKRTLLDRLNRLSTAFKSKDAAAIAEELESKDSDETPEEKADREKKESAKTGDSIATLTRSVDSLTKVVAKLVKDAEAAKEKAETDDEDLDDEEKKTTDTVLEAEVAEKNAAAQGKVLSGDSLKAVIARAEILKPGITLPTRDGAMGKSAIEDFQRKALESASPEVVTPFLAGREIKALAGDALAQVFTGASELMRAKNNDAVGRKSQATKDFGRTSSVSDINARNAQFWADRK